MNKKLNLFFVLAFICSGALLDAVVIRNKVKDRPVYLQLNPDEEIFSAVKGQLLFDVGPMNFDHCAAYRGKLLGIQASYFPFVKGHRPSVYLSRLNENGPAKLEALHQIPLAEVTIEKSDDPDRPKIVLPNTKEFNEVLTKIHQKNVRPKIEESTPLTKDTVGLVTEYCSPL